ncbi:MAG: DcaP family trimeric outer membrane transporter [Pseudomonadota bacterium]
MRAVATRSLIPLLSLLLSAASAFALSDEEPLTEEVSDQTRPAGDILPASTPPTDPPAMSLADVVALVTEQRSQLAQQQLQLDEQRARIDAQDKRVSSQAQQIESQRRLLESQQQKIATLTRELDVISEPLANLGDVSETETTESEEIKIDDVEVDYSASTKLETAAQKAAGKAVSEAQTDDPTRALLEDFKGAWRLPGTDAALAIGGFVKTAVVFNFDPLDISDRFIVGSIPVDKSNVSNSEAQSSITANQSRLNFDLREPTDFGILRAFIEGDFAGQDETFRLRHAFGQWNKILAGKTWSAFVDTEATPEEVDFEGLNGRINVRQSQIRVMPTIGKEYEFQFSMEDPNPQVQNGQGVTRFPDVVMTSRFEYGPRLHVKAALLLRQIRAQRTQSEGAGVAKKHGWGVSLSGRFNTPKFDARDNVLFQINHGKVIGRYVNDLSSVGDYDGIFNPETGNLELFDVTAGYLSLQHWWGRNSMRSNFTLGAVYINNPSFVSGDAYKDTLRFSANLFWSPTPRIDIGGEYLWGRRENQNGDEGDATQIQLSLRYRF